MKITRKQIKQLHRLACNDATELIRKDLTTWFPEAFKPKVKNGWYKGVGNIMLYVKDDVIQYGISRLGEWIEGGDKENDHISTMQTKIKKATREELDVALEKECIRRGIVIGSKINNSNVMFKINIHSLLGIGEDIVLSAGGEPVFYGGEWAIAKQN